MLCPVAIRFSSDRSALHSLSAVESLQRCSKFVRFLGTSKRAPLKTETVRMRISATQKQALTAAAERDGLQLSAWLRQLALRAAGMLPDAK
ncbi:MAG: plasmid mobilization protein [Bryobacteraceae bacterium]